MFSKLFPIPILKDELALILIYLFFSCWQNDEVAGTIRLVVEKRLKLEFDHHLMLIGIVVIMSTFLYVFARAYFGRKYAIIKE